MRRLNSSVSQTNTRNNGKEYVASLPTLLPSGPWPRGRPAGTTEDSGVGLREKANDRVDALTASVYDPETLNSSRNWRLSAFKGNSKLVKVSHNFRHWGLWGIAGRVWPSG